MVLANRMSQLGTENAFAVAARAARHIADGHTVYPFHLGDLNFKTPEHISEAMLKALKDGKTGYCPAAGILPLRAALADDINFARGTNYHTENILIQPGGKPVIAKFLMSFMNEKDEVLFPNPGFPIYESQVEYLGGVAVPYGFKQTAQGYSIDIEKLEASITPRTRLIIINDFHNPTGSECTKEEREQLAHIILKYKLIALIDEAYFDIRYEGKSHSILSLPEMEERCVMLYTFSKKFAMTGWRVGALVAPQKFIESMAKLNVNMESCTSHFSQYGALAALTGDTKPTQMMLASLKQRRNTAVSMLNKVKGIQCPSPACAFYLFPEVTELMQNKGFNTYAGFAEDLLMKTGVSLCTREHFGKLLPHELMGKNKKNEPGEQNRQAEHKFFVRLAYSGIDERDIIKAINLFQAYAE